MQAHPFSAVPFGLIRPLSDSFSYWRCIQRHLESLIGLRPISKQIGPPAWVLYCAVMRPSLEEKRHSPEPSRDEVEAD